MGEELELQWADGTGGAESLEEAIGAEAAKHSARYLRERNRRLYDAITLALSYGIPVSVICRKVGVGENTVRAVAFEEAATLEEGKRQLAGNVRKFLHGATMRLAENVHELDLDKLPAAIRALGEYGMLLEGAATQIIRHEHVVSHDDLTARIAQAQARAGTVVEVEAAETGSAGGNLLAGDAGGLDVLGIGARGDCEGVEVPANAGTGGYQAPDSDRQSI